MSEDGIIIMAIAVNYNLREISAGPDVQMRGFVYVKDSEQLLKQIRSIFVTTVSESLSAANLILMRRLKKPKPVLKSTSLKKQDGIR